MDSSILIRRALFFLVIAVSVTILHSPARAGLVVGCRCTIEATFAGQEYVVAEWRWLLEDPPIRMNFTPESEKFAEATKRYQEIWKAEGGKMIEALENISGLKFRETEIPAIVFEGASSSGFGDIPMKLRASYPEEVKRATLIHELGHRLISQLRKRPADLDEHRILFLFLYEVWTELYGKNFADRMVEVEKKRKGLYDYESAWNWALKLNRDERERNFKDIVKDNSKQQD